MKIDLHIGELCEAPADVICVSTNPHLELMAGTGGAVRDLGGWEIQDECNAIIKQQFETTGRRYLPMGSAVPTTAGKLPFMGVVMCVAIDPFHQSSREIIADCTRHAIELASSKWPAARTIAIPVFASGNGRFDFETALNAIVEVIKSAQVAMLDQTLIVVRDLPQITIAKKILAKR